MGVLDQPVAIARLAVDDRAQLAQRVDVTVQRPHRHTGGLGQPLCGHGPGLAAQAIHQVKQAVHPGHGPALPLLTVFVSSPA